MTTLESYQLYFEEVSNARKINTSHYIANLQRRRTKKGKE